MYKDLKIDKEKVLNNAVTAIVVVLVIGILAGAFYVILFSGKDKITINSNSTEMKKSLSRIEEAFDKIKTNYIEDVDMEKLVNGAISGMAVATDDPYTRYMSQEEYNEVITSGTEVYGGIGVHITNDRPTGGILVMGIMPGTPAQKEDIKPGDVILQVGEKVVTIENYKECIDDMKGQAGEKVSLTVKRGEELIYKDVTREDVHVNNISSEVLDGNIGYIKVWAFDNDIYVQFKAQYEQLISKNIKGLVIDVRDNPGGLVDETVNILNILLPESDILKLVYKNGENKVYKTDNKSEIKVPLAVLANSRSASASEILAGAIKDSGKGAIIGTKTYGKGIVQSVQKLSGDGALSITVAKYYTPSGVEIHKNGIEPNIQIELPEELKNTNIIEKSKDTQLQKAIEYINSNKK